ncbi:MAG: DUF3102 domain-containing protein [Bacillota bacterium]
MSELMITRTPELIAAEINNIKNQTRKMVLYNSIEIGRRLHEAKALVEHGEWGAWLESSVNYSQRTANNLMRIFEEYGAAQLSLLGDNANSQALANLSYTQAVALLGVPEEDREKFVEENDIDSLSTRELQKLIKEKQELENKLKFAEEVKEAAEKQAKEYSKKVDEISKERDKQLNQIEHLKTKLADASSGDPKKVKQLEMELQGALKRVEELTEELKTAPTLEPAVIEKVPDDIQKELDELRRKNKELEQKVGRSDASIVKYTAHFETLVSNFKNLLSSLGDIKKTSESEYEKYRNAVSGLISKIERMI